MYEEDKDRNWNREPEEERPKKGRHFKEGSLDHSGGAAVWYHCRRCDGGSTDRVLRRF